MMIRAKGKYKFAKRELKKPLGYVHPIGHQMVAVCVKKDGIWQASYEYSHRIVFAFWHGITLTREDHIHHIDGDKLNNHWSNLSRLDRQDHLRINMSLARKSRRENLRGKSLRSKVKGVI